MPSTDNGIYYEEHGEGPSTIVLLPGLGCSIAAWADVVPLLNGYRAIRMDLPGHGGSFDVHADGSSLSALAAPIAEACDQLGLDRYSVVGLSLGGAVGMSVAASRTARVAAVMAVMPWPAGGIEAGDQHYYRIQTPVFLIEYDKTQDNGNHIHSVWRDFNGDFGQDLLAQHYAADHK